MTPPIKIADTHIHMIPYTPEEYGWILEMGLKGVAKDFLLHQLEEEAEILESEGFDMSEAVFVQAREARAEGLQTETNFLLELAKQSPRRTGVVGYIDLKRPDLEEALRPYDRDPHLVGFREILQARNNPSEYAGDPDFRRGIDTLAKHGLVYDILLQQKDLPAAVELAKHNSDITFVIDHLNKPSLADLAKDQRGPESFKYWFDHMAQLAELPNVYLKISAGILEEDPKGWNEQNVGAYITAALTLFGPDRVVVGSNAPVIFDAYHGRSRDNQPSRMTQWFETVHGCVDAYASGLDDPGKAVSNIMQDNAVRAYNLADIPRPTRR